VNEQELRRRNQELEQMIEALQIELITRAMPTVPQLSDGLRHLARNARTGNAPARTVLRDLFAALEEGRAAASGIELVKTNGH
jgi:hypothetical protein